MSKLRYSPVITHCVQLGCDRVIVDPKDKHVLCSLHRPCDAQCPCEYCPPENVSSVVSMMSRQGRSLVSPLDPGHSIRGEGSDMRGQHRLEPGHPIRGEGSNKKKAERSDSGHPIRGEESGKSSQKPKPSQGHKSREHRSHSRSSKSSVSGKDRDDRSKRSTRADDPIAPEKTADGSAQKESFVGANLRLTAQVESYRIELEAIKATLRQQPELQKQGCTPSIVVLSGENEFAEDRNRDQHNQDEIGANDSASPVQVNVPRERSRTYLGNLRTLLGRTVEATFFATSTLRLLRSPDKGFTEAAEAS